MSLLISFVYKVNLSSSLMLESGEDKTLSTKKLVLPFTFYIILQAIHLEYVHPPFSDDQRRMTFSFMVTLINF